MPKTKQQIIDEIYLLEEIERKRKQNLCLEYFNCFYNWQMEFCASTLTYFESCLCAANQIGKTRVGTVIDAFHLTGDYPDNYPGHRFDFAPKVWGLGYSMEKTRDLLQEAIFGVFTPQEGFAGGLIPKDRIHSYESAQGTVNAMRTVRVKHKYGISTMQFWSYSQGQHAMMGDRVDHSHVDEESKDQAIRGQLIRASINGNRGKGGKIMYTFTPENGRTELVVQFMDTPTEHQFFMQKGWDHAPHMTEEKKKRLLGLFPAHQRDMRSKGDPMLGVGRIYDIADDFVLCDPFEIPDHFKIICGLDFGYDHPQGVVKLAYDQEADIIYVTNSWKAREVSPPDARFATRKWVKNYPVAWPLDGLHNESRSTDSLKVKTLYKDAGFKMLFEHATWPKGGNSREAGILDIINRIKRGTFKIFKGQPELMDEFRQYHRNESGDVVKTKDDILDAVRTAFMMLRYAKYNKEAYGLSANIHVMPEPIGVIGIRN